MRPSFLFTCCLLFIISSPKIVVSRNFLSILILFWAVFICSFSILRDSQLESDVCHLQYKWSSNSLVVEIQPFKNSKSIEKIHNVHRGLGKCLAIHTIPSRFSSFLKGCILFHLGLINVEILYTWFVYLAIRVLWFFFFHYPLPLWGFSGIMKQIIQMEHNKVKNPTW